MPENIILYKMTKVYEHYQVAPKLAQLPIIYTYIISLLAEGHDCASFKISNKHRSMNKSFYKLRRKIFKSV